MTPSAPPAALRLIQGAPELTPGWSWFCSHCGAAPSDDLVSPLARVCGWCGTGMLLETRSDAAPFPDDAFLVVDSDLTVQALSHQAQRLLGKTEHDVIDWPITYFLGPADAENGEIGGFMNLLHDATMGSEDLQSVCVRPLGAFGVRVVARIAPCGPPRAALVVLSTQMPRLDLRIVRPRASTLPA